MLFSCDRHIYEILRVNNEHADLYMGDIIRILFHAHGGYIFKLNRRRADGNGQKSETNGKM